MNCWSSFVLLLAVMAFVFAFHTAEAKRGCAAFGHSCYGGTGKRSREAPENNEEILQDVQSEENPAFVFTGPRSEYRPERPPKLTPEQYDNISRVIRQWIQSYRRAQEMRPDNI
ncbi:neuropeptide CCHamide-2 [Tribolium madens]|uniref:neuropeptide CCHamide-2 n=1 Tax=Tribolium madens TaxID=41895 RepID=UPI001CF72339|nr:neuropeptide CCHamide-2 [Tribolium madens]